MKTVRRLLSVIVLALVLGAYVLVRLQPGRRSTSRQQTRARSRSYGGFSDGRQQWGYVLVRNAHDEPWRIIDQGAV